MTSRWRSLVGCSPWGHEASNTTELTSLSLSFFGEGNGNPLQCSCLENPRDGRAWGAAVYWVAQSRIGLKRLCSNSSSRPIQDQRTKLCSFSLFSKRQLEDMTHKNIFHSSSKVKQLQIKLTKDLFEKIIKKFTEVH